MCTEGLTTTDSRCKRSMRSISHNLQTADTTSRVYGWLCCCLGDRRHSLFRLRVEFSGLKGFVC